MNQHDPQIVPLDSRHPLWPEVPGLFRRMYEGMAAQGLPFGLAPGGESMWVKNVAFALGKYGILLGAVHEQHLVGFAHGLMKNAPDYLGGSAMGFVSHVYVVPELRKAGIAKRMFDGLEAWFRDRGVASIELQVLCANAPAVAFWASLGFHAEITQMRKGLT